MIKTGITGIIGSGKSVVSSVFQIMGIPVYNADDQAKIIMNTNKDVQNEIIINFGSNAFKNDKLNKQYIASQIFNDNKKRKLINSIVHPAVKNNFIKWTAQQTTRICAIESALIYESQFDKILDAIIMVISPQEVLIDRICKRDNIETEEAVKRINSQNFYNNTDIKPDYYLYNDDEHSIILQSIEIIRNIQDKW
ncbi:MAG: dephospho-CoA kinase [Bacteroidales bacterium]|nr:dephospho-CoA kinase [Bacteroidales bacterium]